MSDVDVRETVLSLLREVAPEVADVDLDPALSFRDQFDFDSVDFLNFALTLEKKLGVTIPETDYPKLSSLNGTLEYLEGQKG